MNEPTIAFIGGGNMAGSLISGVIAHGFNPEGVWVSDPNEERLDELADRFSVNTTPENRHAIGAADIVVLAVKPQVLEAVCSDIAAAVQEKNPLIVSIAAGVPTAILNQWLNGNVALIRTMPNTPASIGCGATALYATAMVSERQRNLAETLMRSVGITIWVDDEAHMDAVTALSGSGPAYFFLVMEAIEKTGVRLGLPTEASRLLTLQTAFGAAKMALESSDDVAVLRQRVTSPGGTTERAITALEEGNLMNLFETALTAAHRRSIELAELLGGKK